MWLGYTRVSSVGTRGDRLISPEMQRRRIQAFADGRGLEVEMLDSELDISGSEINRPILGRAIEQIERGEAAGLIVATLDRLSRMTIVDALRTIERIEAAGGDVIAVAENFDPTTPEGRMVRNIHLSIAEAQRERYAGHIADAKRQAVARGIWPMPKVPRGYAKGHKRALVPDPETAPTVRRAFELRASGAPWSAVAGLLGCGYSGAGRTIRSRVYLGEIHLSISGESVINRRAHEPLVSRELWEAAQISHPRPPRGSDEGALLAGLLRCAHCSRLMTLGDRLYRCFPRKASGDCLSPALISASVIEPHIESLALAELERAEVEGRPVTSTEAERKALEAAEDELAQWREAVRIADVGPEHVADALQRHVQAVEQARKALARAQTASTTAVEGLDAVEAYRSLSVAGRRHALSRAIGVVWVRKGRGLGRVKVVAAGFEPPDLSGPGRAAPPIAVEWTDLPGEIRPPLTA